MTSQPTSRVQQGSMLLEALISILIFSIGILAIVGLQASSITMSTDAKYRSDASLLANQHIAAMWADLASSVRATTGTGTPIAFNSNQFTTYTTGGANFQNWYNTFVAGLPNASAVVAANTTITCGNVACPPTPVGVQQNTRTNVTVRISWTLPGGGAHTYSTTALLSAQKQL